MDRRRSVTKQFSSFLVVWLFMSFKGSVSHQQSQEEQKRLLWEASEACQRKMQTDPYLIEGAYCNRTWDTVLCWPDALPSTTVRIRCPDYISGFNTEHFATKQCLSNGEWFKHPIQNTSYSNYNACTINTDRYKIHPLIQEHIGNIRLLFNICYGISLVALFIAVLIMLYLKNLHCERNYIHLNLFVSFILRAVISFVKGNILVDDVGLPSDLVMINGTLTFDTSPDKTHWECRLLFTCFQYTIIANYLWIFVEGLHLHTLIFITAMTRKKLLIWYMLIGWATPLLFVIPWVLVRIHFANTLCWNTHENNYLWIIRGPVIGFHLVNFGFFLNIVRALLTKIRASNTSNPLRYKKLAKATLVLIPLFGVHYIVFICIPDDLSPTAEVVVLYIEMFFNSFQGFVVALLFCFLNGEVRTEIRKKWYRRMMRRGSTRTNYTLTSEVTRDHKTQAHSVVHDRKDTPRYTNYDSGQEGNGSVGNRLDDSPYYRGKGYTYTSQDKHPDVEMHSLMPVNYNNNSKDGDTCS